MNAIYQKIISTSLLKLALSLFLMLLIQVAANAQTFQLGGTWEMYTDKNVKFDKPATISQSGANLSINNGYGSNSTAVLNGNTFTTSDGLTGTISTDGTRINWNIGYVWVKQGSTANNQPNKIESETTLTSADSGMITRTVTFKNNGGFTVFGSIDRMDLSNKITRLGKSTKELGLGNSESIGSGIEIPLTDSAEIKVGINNSLFSGKDVTVFKANLPKNKALTTYCFDISGTYFVPVVKACDGGATYESKYILFKNEAGFDANMTLTFYPLGSSTPTTTSMPNTSAGYQRKLYLPLNADTNRQMTLKVSQINAINNDVMLSKDVDLSAFDTSGSTCYKVWGSILSKKISPCSANTSARTIKLKNNGAYQAKMQVTYDDNGTSKTVSSNPLEVLESDTVEVPQTSSTNPIKIRFLAYGKEFNTTTISANFTGELCYKLEGTAFAPTAATCDDTIGDTSGETRQIRFQNEAGYDAQMIVSYFVDEVINGTTIAMPKILTTGMINGLGGKFRLVTIPKNTSKGQPITISLQGNATVKGNNAIFSTTLSADFAASPQPCFKVTGTLFDPAGGKCNQ